RDRQRDQRFGTGADGDPRVRVQAGERQARRNPRERSSRIADLTAARRGIAGGELDVRDPRVEEFSAEGEDRCGAIELVARDFVYTERELAGAQQRLVVERFVEQPAACVQRAEPRGRQPLERTGQQLANPRDPIRTLLPGGTQLRREQRL